MTPDFVLSLFFEGIRLHRRTAEGWDLVGEVPLDSPDLARDLHALRDAGIATETPWTGTKLLLPPEQIRVLDLEGERDLAGVHAALEGVTPYAVADLVVDWEVRDGRTHVAAVARETLDEAEAFAAEHGFLPTSFAAPLEGFPREADFGPTRLAATLPATTSEPARVEASPPAAEPPIEVPAAAQPDPSSSVEPSSADVAPLATSDAPDTASPEPLATSDAAAPATVVPPAAEPPATEPAPADAQLTPEPPPDPAAPTADPVPEPIFASRARPLRAERHRPFDGPPTVRQPEGRRVEPSVRKPPPPPSEGWALNSTGASARPDPRMPPRQPAVAIRPGKPAGPLGSATEVLRSVPVAAADAPAPEPSEVPPAPLPPAMSAAPALAASRPTGSPSITPQVFQREEPAARPRGKPRFLGLILTVLLLIAMAAVALWASTSEQGLAGLFRQADPPTTVAAAPPPVDTVAPGLVAPEAIVAAPSPAPEPSPEDLASARPAPPPTLDAEDAAAAAAAVTAAMADLSRAAEPPSPVASPDPLAAAAAPAPEGADAAVPPAEADRFYAATGVWLRAPGLSLLPEAEAGAALRAPAPPPPSPARNPAEEPPLLAAAVAPEARPTVEAEPATPSAEPAVVDVGPALAPEAATPEVRTAAGPPPPPVPPASEPPTIPAWVNAMAEPPAVLPPERPETPEGFAVATAEVQGPPAPAAAPSAGEWVNAMAEPPDALPPERPDAPAEFLASLEAEQAAGPALQPGALAFAATPDAPTPGGVDLAGLRPAPRPEDLAPPGGEPPPTILASFDGPRPGPRPEGLAPEPEIESPDVSQALAEALAAPATPAAPDLQSTLAAIVEGAPDPLAGATPRAVAVARVPDVRPRNFGQVVQRQLDRVARASQAPAAGGVGTGDLTAQEQAEAAGEAEAASSAAAAPSGVTPTTVAQAATLSDAMRLREINLIGVYGQPNARRALIRLANGRYVRVGVGDQFDGGQVTAIGDNALNYTRRGRTFQLVIPGG